jgi:hypothetical protein
VAKVAAWFVRKRHLAMLRPPILPRNARLTPALDIGAHSEVKGKASDPYRHMVGLNSNG